MDDDVPILIPTVNASHLGIIEAQRKNKNIPGFIITNANCSTTAMSIGLKPIHEKFGLEKVIVSTMQAISGAGYPGLSSMDIFDNVVPHIGGEEGKMETEAKKILGTCVDGSFQDADFMVRGTSSNWTDKWLSCAAKAPLFLFNSRYPRCAIESM
mmetsp:Transcript_5979/g.25242  ORF Transcript_5979/g.25242 Transcript_5979/m.25242 type:complete len:155 (+) Transcript_5979:913-1377(+)